MSRGRIALLAAALAVPLALAAIALAPGGGAGGGNGAQASSGPSGTAAVKRRTLAETLTAGGTIGYAGESAVLARLSGTVTWLPRVGDVVRRGEPLYELAGEPALLMYGSVPAYRELAEGVADGEDVRQLEANLAALGFEPGSVDDEFTAATAAAVRAWQEELGLQATGAVELGRVAFLPGPRRVTGIEASLGESIGSGGGGLADSEGEEATAIPAVYEPERTNLPSAESPSEGEGEGEGEGSGGSEPSSVPVLQTTSTRRIVTVDLEPDQQSLARRGQRVEVVLPDGSEATGRVERLAASASSAEEVPGEETEAGVEVTVALTGHKRIPALDGASVSVVFTQRVRKHVLSVPLTALLAVGAGRYAVVAEEGSRRRRVTVTPGLAANGYVEVRGKGLRQGMRVEVGE